MNLRRIATMYLRDLRDALKDGRILIAVLLPVGLAVYYSIAIPDESARPKATLHVVGDRGSQVVDDVRSATEDTIDLSVEGADDERAARAAVRDDDSDVALILGEGEGDPATLLVNEDPTAGASVLSTTVGQVAAVPADVEPRLDLEVDEVKSSVNSPFERMGIDLALGVFAIMMLAGFIAMLAVPVLLLEEVTLRTLEALQLVATTAEIILAKLLVGLTYCAVAIAITIPAASLDLANPALFVAAALLVSVTLSGFGLAFGLALGDPGRVNTWSGVVLLPLLIPVFTAIGERQPWTWVGDLFPTGAGAQLLTEAALPSALELGIVPWVVMAVWTIGGFGTLWWLLARRDA